MKHDFVKPIAVTMVIAAVATAVAFCMDRSVEAATPAPTVAQLQSQLTAAQATIQRLAATNTAVVKGIRACQAQRNAAQDKALDDAMNAQ